MHYLFNLSSNYPHPFDGVWDIPSKAMGVGVNRINLSIDRCTSNTPQIWSNANTSVEISFQVSYDHEKTWTDGGYLLSNGGIALIDGVKEGLQTTAFFKYNEDITHLKTKITVTNGPLVSNLRIWAGE